MTKKETEMEEEQEQEVTSTGDVSQESAESVTEETSDSQTEENDVEIEIEEDIPEADKKYEELNGKYMRLYAEFENFRRRSARESLEMGQNANAKFMEKLLPTLENLTSAFSPEHKATKLEDFESGIKMIFNSFKDVLEESGLEEVDPEGEEFDPNIHEALMQQAHDDIEEGHIIQVFKKGYKLKSKIIKHAQVITSKGKE